MRIHFRTKKLQRLCEKYKEASMKWGHECAKKIFQRINELRAADNLKIFVSKVHPRCHPLKGNREGQYSADLKHPMRLIFYPCDESANIIRESNIDLAQIKNVLIYEVVDYHG